MLLKIAESPIFESYHFSISQYFLEVKRRVMQAVMAFNILIKMAGEWRFNPSVHRANGDRLVRARVLPVCNNVMFLFLLTMIPHLC